MTVPPTTYNFLTNCYLPEDAQAKDWLGGRDLEGDGGEPVRPDVPAQRGPEGGDPARVVAEVPRAEVLDVMEHGRACPGHGAHV